MFQYRLKTESTRNQGSAVAGVFTSSVIRCRAVAGAASLHKLTGVPGSTLHAAANQDQREPCDKHCFFSCSGGS